MGALTLLLIASLQLSFHLPCTAAQRKETTNCADKECLRTQFDALALSRGLYAGDGAVCKGDPGYVRGTSNSTCSSCVGVYQVCEQLVLKGLGQVAVKSGEDTNSNCQSTQSKPYPYEAYGYGFLISVAISLTSLLAIFIVPFLKEGTTLGKFYKAIYAFMMGSSSSALFCDAILIILPEVLFARETNTSNIKDNNTNDTPVSSLSELSRYDQLWIGSAVCSGMFAFFIWEFIYTTLYRKCKPPKPAAIDESFEQLPYQWAVQRDLPRRIASREASRQRHRGEDLLLTQQQQERVGLSSNYYKHGYNETTALLPQKRSSSKRRCISCGGFASFIRSIKPLAWLIIVGDGLHNLTDGVALGVAMSKSLSLGLSTGIALVLSEIPHELGDFVVLLSTGMKWPVALLLNFLHALTALAGFFVGVAVGTASDTAVTWILGATVSVFIYIALVDLIPPLLDTTEQGTKLLVYFLTASLGFVFSFVIVLVIAVEQQNLNCLLT